MTKLDVCIKWLDILLQLEDQKSDDLPSLVSQFRADLESAKPRPPVAKLPLISFDLMTGRLAVPHPYFEIWERAYPAVNVRQEVEAAGAWLVANPKKAPRSSYSRFLNGWLNKTQQRGGTRGFIQSAGVDKAEAWAKT